MAPNELGWEEIRIGIALTTITGAAVVLRFVARFVKKLKFEWDDWLAIASFITIIAMLVELILWATIGSSGKHFMTLTPPEMEMFFKVFLANEFTYSITSPLVKITLLMFYRRIFSTRQFRIVADTMTALCILWGSITLIVVGLQCRPLAHYWNIMIPGTCINQIAFVEGIQGINVFLDLVILIMPLPMVWGLNRPWQDKMAICAVFLLGGFVCGASIYRLVALTQIDVQDISYSTYSGIIWTFVEPCIGLVCACLPIIRGLFPAYTSTKRTTKGTGNSSGNYSSGWRQAPMQSHGKSHHASAHYFEMDDDYSRSSRNGDVENLVKPHAAPYGNHIGVRTTVEVR